MLYDPLLDCAVQSSTNRWDALAESPEAKDSEPRAVVVGYAPPGGSKAFLIKELVDLNILRAQAAAKDEQIANLSKWYKAACVTISELEALIAKFSAPENPKLAAGEALANAFRADNFSNPYGR